MASSDPATPKLSVDDILAFSEAELVQYMKQNCRPDGGFELDLEGWENLPKDQRDQLAERLRMGAQKANDTLESRPVDLDQVAARLQEISDDQDALPQALSRPSRHDRAPTEEVDFDEEAKKSETFDYNDLVNDGGRPAYPINLLEEVSKDPDEYRELLQPWQQYPDASPPDWKEVFWTQLNRWQEFRLWQTGNRGLQDDKREYLEFVEMDKLHEIRRGRTWLQMYPLSTESEHDRIRRSIWGSGQAKRKNDWYWLRENHGRGEFPEYVEEVKRRLAQHGFTRTFQLDKDPKRQDKMTTWIEYLNYEYSWYDRYTRSLKRLKPQYDEAWKNLVGSGVLRAGETDEYLRTTESSLQRANEREQAEKAVKSAESAAKAALIETEKARNGRSSLNKQERTRRLAAAHSRLVAAKASLKSIKRRGDLITEFIRGTWDYQGGKRNVYRHGILLQWILEQVPLIEAELHKSKVAEGSSHAGRGVERSRRNRDNKVAKDRKPINRKRRDQISSLSDGYGSPAQAREPKRRRDDTTEIERPSKRLRNDGQDSNSHGATSTRGSQGQQISAVRNQGNHDQAAMKTRKVPNNRPLHSTDVPHPPAISQQLRRSPRLMARQDSSGIAAPPPCGVKASHRKPRRKVVQAPTPPSSTESQDRQPRSPLTKAPKGRGARGGVRLGTKPKGLSKRRRPPPPRPRAQSIPC